MKKKKNLFDCEQRCVYNVYYLQAYVSCVDSLFLMSINEGMHTNRSVQNLVNITFSTSKLISILIIHISLQNPLHTHMPFGNLQIILIQLANFTFSFNTHTHWYMGKGINK